MSKGKGSYMADVLKRGEKNGRIQGLEMAKVAVDTVCQMDRMLTDDEARLIERINEVLDADIEEVVQS